MKPQSVRIVVLHYNRRDLLERFLPSVMTAAKRCRIPCGVTVLDNCSKDDSVAYVRAHFPEADVFIASRNKVLYSFNEAAAHYKEDVLIFLNNDVQLEEGAVDPILDAFAEHEDAFFVSTYGDRSLPVFHRGVLGADIYYRGFEHAIQREGYALSAGIGGFDRRRFLDIGGYDEMYLPGYYEDVDLCYRAWRRGYRGYHAPRSRQYHIGGASFSKAYQKEAIQKLVLRNSLLFMMKNVSDPWYLARFWVYLAGRAALSAVTGRWKFIMGVREAWAKRAEARAGRSREIPFRKIADRSIIRLIRNDIKVHRS